MNSIIRWFSNLEMNLWRRVNSVRITLALLAMGIALNGQRVITSVAGTDYVFPGANEPASGHCISGVSVRPCS